MRREGKEEGGSGGGSRRRRTPNHCASMFLVCRGLGPASAEYLLALTQLFPELDVVLLDVEDELDSSSSPSPSESSPS
eukprot:2026957-Pyramimonas_sp.AAC.1